MLKIFVDADAFVALASKNDSNHAKAVAFINSQSQKQVVFSTSNFVVSEVITVLSLRVSKSAAIKFIEVLRDPKSSYTVLKSDDFTDSLAIDIFKAQTSKNVSYVDCSNMALIKTHKLDAIFSFDKIYRKNGLKTVPSWPIIKMYGKLEMKNGKYFV